MLPSRTLISATQPFKLSYLISVILPSDADLGHASSSGRRDLGQPVPFVLVSNTCIPPQTPSGFMPPEWQAALRTGAPVSCAGRLPEFLP